jgi:uncharacterized membrane protein
MDLQQSSQLNEERLYIPNHIPLSTRLWNMLFSVGLLAYGTIGILNDDVYLPGKRGNGIHFHGIPAWLIYGAMICAVLNMLSVIADHLDQRNNETNYRRFAKVTQYGGWTLFGIALVLDVFVLRHLTRP